MNTRPPIVLVHGAWSGAWIWRRVLPLLRKAGHEVHAVTLSGCGERQHFPNAAISLATHIQDVLALVAAEELQDVVLVGHSYGGIVVTGVADALLAEAPGTLRQLIYVDAIVPAPGEFWGSLHTPAEAAARRVQAARSGNALPPPDPASFGLQGPDRDWLMRRQVAQPFGSYGDPLHFDADRVATLPTTVIDCIEPRYVNLDSIRERLRATPRIRLLELRAGHFPMVSHPAELASLLLAEIRQSTGAA
ncbi:MAG: alpha/beta hydrolase [Gammaproteobacteria bacterium]|nr:alpha/beta hydrolase [Gammaproteobacteria bacterium]